MNQVSVVRSAVSGTVIAVVVIVVVLVVGAGAYFGLGLGKSGGNSTVQTTSTTPTTNTTNTGGNPPPGSLNTAVGTFLSDFNNRDVTSIKTFFTDSSTIVWGGSAGGLQGTYHGIDGAGIVYATSVGHTSSLSATVSNQQNSSTGATTSTVTYHLSIHGVSSVVGPFNSTVDVSQDWTYQGGAWTIQNDNWNYLSFESNNPSEATVFPQWGLSMNGKSPSLAGEHVLEWNLAPFLAIGVYVTIVALGLALLWVRIRKQRK